MKLSTEFATPFIRQEGRTQHPGRTYLECDVYPVDEIDKLLLHLAMASAEIINARESFHPHVKLPKDVAALFRAAARINDEVTA